MSNPSLDKELDPNPLVESLIEKTKARKLNWEATANASAFITSVGGESTLKVYLDSTEDLNEYGQMTTIEVPVLCLLDNEGRTLWEIRGSQVKGSLRPLYSLAQRIGNRLDEKMAAILETLEKL